MKFLIEENENLKKFLQNYKGENKKQGKMIIELQEKLAFTENAYTEVRNKFHDSYFVKMEKLYNIQFSGDNEAFPHLEFLNEVNTEIEENSNAQYPNLKEILAHRPKEKAEIKGKK